MRLPQPLQAHVLVSPSRINDMMQRAFALTQCSLAIAQLACPRCEEVNATGDTPSIERLTH